MTKIYESHWWCGYNGTAEQYAEILDHHPEIGTQNLTHILINYHYNLKEAMAQIETLKGRIYELEQTIDGRDTNGGLARSEWAWPEKEDDDDTLTASDLRDM